MDVEVIPDDLDASAHNALHFSCELDVQATHLSVTDRGPTCPRNGPLELRCREVSELLTCVHVFYAIDAVQPLQVRVHPLLLIRAALICRSNMRLVFEST